MEVARLLEDWMAGESIRAEGMGRTGGADPFWTSFKGLLDAVSWGTGRLGWRGSCEQVKPAGGTSTGVRTGRRAGPRASRTQGDAEAS